MRVVCACACVHTFMRVCKSVCEGVCPHVRGLICLWVPVGPSVCSCVSCTPPGGPPDPEPQVRPGPQGPQCVFRPVP